MYIIPSSIHLYIIQFQTKYTKYFHQKDPENFQSNHRSHAHQNRPIETIHYIKKRKQQPNPPIQKSNRFKIGSNLSNTVLLSRLHNKSNRVVIKNGDILRAVLEPSRQTTVTELGFPGVGDIDIPVWVGSGGNNGGDVLVVAGGLLACDAAAVGAELGGHCVLATDNVVFVYAAALGTAHCEVGDAPDDVVGDCLGLEGGWACGG